ncbi:MAG: hypothetical protein AUH92_04370 [Acidobacteria bacterium 13_1_40CM_4_69_4]|nr:MAG: hypothetical protein AUH92_04370 [Acidobacteria bacterium 13_1_40CM_4_69_4]
MRQRLSGNGAIPARARARALQEARARGALVSAPGSWISAGPFNIGGRVTALGVDPNDGNHLWLGSAEGGVFVSTDGGTGWSPVFDGETALSIGSIAAHPHDSGTVYVGTGEDNGGGFSYDGEGVFKTTDGGATWIDLGLAEVRRVGRIAIDPLDPRRVFVAAGGDWFNRDANRGIYRSIDGGTTWDKVLYVADDSGGIDVAIDPGDTNRVYAAIWQRQSLGSSWYIAGPNSGIFRSTDGGATWSRMTNGLPGGPDVGRIGLAVSRSSPNIVFALVIDGRGQLFGLYRTTDAGDSWTGLGAASLLLNGFSYYFGNIRVDPVDPNTVYVLDSNLLRSSDGGTTFSIIAANVHPDWHDLIITDRAFLAGNDAGFFRSRNGGSSWEHAVTLPITQLYDLAIDRLLPQQRFGGSQDTGTLRTKTGDPSGWQTILGGDGLQCEVDYTNSSIVYAENQYGQIYRSTNGGNSFVRAMIGLDANERRNWNTPITLDPVVPATLYTGYQRVFRSTDSAGFWSPISPDLTGGTGAAVAVSRDPDTGPGPDHLKNLVTGTITVVGVSPADHRVLWAGTDDGNVWVSGDFGSTWSKVNPPGPAYWVTDIAGDPFDARAAYLSVTGYRQGDSLPYVRATADLGATWRDLSGALPRVPINCILPDSDWRGRLYAGSDIGVHLSDDGGASWSIMSGGMPYVVVMDLVRHDPTHTLFAGTHGRSIYSYDLGQLPPADGDGDGVDNNHDCALADPGAFAPPGEVGPLAVGTGPAPGAVLSWPSLAATAGPGTLYDVAIGDLTTLSSGGTAASTALACGLSVTTAIDETTPAPGAGVYYLVRARNACAAGSWGTDSPGIERSVPACP